MDKCHPFIPLVVGSPPPRLTIKNKVPQIPRVAWLSLERELRWPVIRAYRSLLGVHHLLAGHHTPAVSSER